MLVYYHYLSLNQLRSKKWKIFKGSFLSEQGLGSWEVVAGMFILAGVVFVEAIATAPIRQRGDLRKYAKTLIPEVELEFI